MGGLPTTLNPRQKIQIITGITSRGEKDIVNDERFIDVLPVIAINL
jgi:hypothetical protein